MRFLFAALRFGAANPHYTAGPAIAGGDRMQDPEPLDYYETLQISANAEPETVHRIYRMLAQRYHPDNAETGNDARFRQIAEAYRVLSDPNERARYDAVYERQRQARWRLANLSATADTDFESEQQLRVTVLEVLYTKRRVEPQEPGLFHIDLEKLTGCPREHLEFTLWYLVQKKFVQRTDNSLLAITAEGIDYIEARQQTAPATRRLAAVNE
jgi:curved DNA-binding protein CbpA